MQNFQVEQENLIYAECQTMGYQRSLIIMSIIYHEMFIGVLGVIPIQMTTISQKIIVILKFEKLLIFLNYLSISEEDLRMQYLL